MQFGGRVAVADVDVRVGAHELVGLIGTAAIYYPLVKRRANPPAEMIYPAEEREQVSA